MAFSSTPQVEDFIGPAGSKPNAALWNINVQSTVGWSDGEVGDFTADNVYLDGNSNLVIRTQRGARYTSGRVNTRGKFHMTYGRLEARIKVPWGTGLWPGFWMLGTAFDLQAGGNQWPKCGEIDIFEMFANLGPQLASNIHGSGFLGLSTYNLPTYGTPPVGQRFSDDFHMYWVERTPGKIVTGFDNTTVGVYTPSSLPWGSTWAFNAPFYVILNTQVHNTVNSSVALPQSMLVDWIKFYSMA